TSPAAPPGASVFRTDQACVSRAPLLITCLMSTLANRGMPCVGKGFAVKRARLAPKVGLFGLAFSLWAAGLVLARPWPAATTGFVAQPCDAVLLKPLRPLVHKASADPDRGGNLGDRRPIRQQENHPSPFGAPRWDGGRALPGQQCRM